MATTLFAALVTLVAATTRISPATIRRAAAGHIDPDAPIRAALATTVAAPAAIVWDRLAAIDAWPAWLASVASAHLQGPLARGTSFVWTDGGTSIRSTLRRVDPQRSLAWTGRAWGVTVIHVWTLTALSPVETRVEEAESLSGLPARLFLDGETLAGLDEDWLQRLKAAAERPTGRQTSAVSTLPAPESRAADRHGP